MHPSSTVKQQAHLGMKQDGVSKPLGSVSTAQYFSWRDFLGCQLSIVIQPQSENIKQKITEYCMHFK